MKHSGLRELWARKIAVITGTIFLLLAILFAWIQNPPIKENKENNVVLTGMKVFEKQGCIQCHSISGKGSSRFPLDGISSRMSEIEIKEWIVAGPTVRKKLPAAIVSLKSTYTTMPQQEMKQLLILLMNSKKKN